MNSWMSSSRGRAVLRATLLIDGSEDASCRLEVAAVRGERVHDGFRADLVGVGQEDLAEFLVGDQAQQVATKFVLIKHDYYSTDSDHGRDILSGFLTSLTDSSYSSIVIYLIDKGVKLLDEENPLYDKMLRLLEKSETVIAAEESFDEYNVSYPVTQKISIESIMSVTEDITYLDNLLTLE